MTEYWYRYEDSVESAYDYEYERFIKGTEQTVLHCLRLPVDKVTEHGVWIDDFGRRRFVKRCARKRYACPTREEAFESWRARKRRQVSLCRGQLKRAEMALRMQAKPIEERQSAHWNTLTLREFLDSEK